MHIAQGLLRALNVNRLVDAGCIFIFWVADWFALLNNKMGGDLDKIRTVGRYFIEVWKAVGMKMHNVYSHHTNIDNSFGHQMKSISEPMNIGFEYSTSLAKTQSIVSSDVEPSWEEQKMQTILFP